MQITITIKKNTLTRVKGDHSGTTLQSSFALQEISHINLTILINVIDNNCFIKNLRDSFLRHSHFISWK